MSLTLVFVFVVRSINTFVSPTITFFRPSSNVARATKSAWVVKNPYLPFVDSYTRDGSYRGTSTPKTSKREHGPSSGNALSINSRILAYPFALSSTKNAVYFAAATSVSPSAVMNAWALCQTNLASRFVATRSNMETGRARSSPLAILPAIPGKNVRSSATKRSSSSRGRPRPTMASSSGALDMTSEALKCARVPT